MIITITPFPSIEYIYGINELLPNSTLPCSHVSLNVLSKGIYCAQTLKVLQEEPLLISSFGGFAGRYIKHYLDKGRVKSDIVWAEYETPHQVRINQDCTSDFYELRSAYPAFTDKELIKLTHKFKSHMHHISTAVICGHLPSGQDETIYASWIKEAIGNNVKAIVSTGQLEVFNAVLPQKPYAIFLTYEQLKSLGRPHENFEDIIEDLKPLLGNGLHYIAVYLKNRGALLLSKHKICKIESPFQLVNQDNTATSGAFLGALAIGINRKYEQEKISKLCLAAALAVDDNVNHKICTKKDIDFHYKKVKVR